MIESFLSTHYIEHIRRLVKAGTLYDSSGSSPLNNRIHSSLTVDTDIIEAREYDLAEALYHDPNRFLRAGDSALTGIAEVQVGYPPTMHLRIKAPMNGTLIADLGKPTHLNKLVTVSGVLIGISPVYQRLIEGGFECKRCGNIMKIPQASVATPKGKLREPFLCESCEKKGPWTLLSDESKYQAIQYLKVQEDFEKAGGSQPRLVLVLAKDDLTREEILGTQVTITGILEAEHDQKNLDAKNFISATHIDFEESRRMQRVFTKNEVEKIREFSKTPDIHRIIKHSIAPNIVGLDDVKEGVGYYVFGSPRRRRKTGTYERGDIHLLLVGDPSVGKSDILIFVNVAFRAMKTSGPGVSGVGLTAAVVQEENKEWSLRPGPLVLCDGGLLCIDEFDKMDKVDRLKLHDPMEDQRVHISKAGITGDFKSRCGILASANPKSGRFDPFRTLGSQFNLPPTILSRFDLIFVIKDDIDHDDDIADSILEESSDAPPVVDLEFLMMYVAYARQNVHPTISVEAVQCLKAFYTKMRRIVKEDSEAPVPITARQLTGLKRLAKARARQRLGKEVTLEDAEAVCKLFMKCMSLMGIEDSKGRLDIGMIDTGMTISQRKRVEIILDIIRGLQRDYDTAKTDEIVAKAKVRGVSKKNAISTIEQLLDDGNIYRPRHGHYKIV